MEVDAAERKRPLEEVSKSKTDDDEDELQPARQARRQESASAVNETDRERSRSPTRSMVCSNRMGEGAGQDRGAILVSNGASGARWHNEEGRGAP